jgi:phage-related minor tail protein
VASTEELIVQIQADLSSFRRQMDEMASQTQDSTEKGESAFSKFSTGAIAAVAGIGVAIGGIVTAIGTMTNEMEVSQGRFQAMLGYSEETAKEMANAAKNVYADAWGESIDHVTGTMAEFGRTLGDSMAGVDEEVTTAALIMEQSFEVGATESSRAIGQMVKQFDMADPIEAFDIMHGVMQRVGGDAGEIVDSFWEYAEPVAQIGLDAQEFGSAIVNASQDGAFSVDKLGDAMKEFSIRAIDGSTVSAEGFGMLGLNADDMFAKFGAGGETAKQAFSETITALGKITDPLKREAAGVALFGGMFEDLGYEAIAGLDVTKTGLIDFTGASAKAGEALSNNLGSKFESIKRTIMMSFADEDSPIYRFILNLTSKVEENLPKIQKAIEDGFQWIYDHGEEIGAAMIGISAGLATFAAYSGISAIMTAIAAAGGLMSFSMGILTTVMTGLGAVMAFVTSPIFLISAAVALLAAGAFLIYKNWDKVSDWFKEIWVRVSAAVTEFAGKIGTWLSEGWNKAKDAVTEGVQKAKDAITNGFSNAKEGLINAWSGVKEFFSNLWSGIVSGVTAAVDFILQPFINAYNNMMTVITPIFEGIKTYLTAFFDSIVLWFTTWWEVIKTLFGTALGVVVAIFTGQWSKIPEILAKGAELVKGLLSGMMDKLKEIWTKAWSTIKDKLSEAWTNLKNVFVQGVQNAIQNIVDMYTKITGWFTTLKTKVIEYATILWTNVKSAFLNGLKAVVTYVSDKIAEVIEFYASLPGKIRDFIVKAMTWMKDKFSSGLTEAKTTIKTKLEDAISFYKELPGKLLGYGKDMINGFIKGVTGMAGTLKSKIKSFVSDNIPGPIKEILGIDSPSKLMMSFGQDTTEGLIQGISDDEKGVTKTVSSLIGRITSPLQGLNSTVGLNIDRRSMQNALSNANITAQAAMTSTADRTMNIQLSLMGGLEKIADSVEARIANRLNSRIGGVLI